MIKLNTTRQDKKIVKIKQFHWYRTILRECFNCSERVMYIYYKGCDVIKVIIFKNNGHTLSHFDFHTLEQLINTYNIVEDITDTINVEVNY